MESLFDSLSQLFLALWDVVADIGLLLLPVIPLAAWIVFWLFGVNWVKLRQVLLQGGWIGVVLIGLVAVLIWGSIAPPLGGSHFILGLKLSNFVGKTVLVTTLFCIMFLCGSVQLSGCCASCCSFEEEPAELDIHDQGH